MSLKHVMGPVLGFRGQDGGNWNVCAIVVTEGADATAPTLEWTATEGGGGVGDGSAAGKKLKSLGGKTVYRFAWSVAQGDGDRRVAYKVSGEGGEVICETNHFVVPASERRRENALRIAYASCNGFSNPKAMKDARRINAMWRVLWNQHTREVYWEGMGSDVRPYHLLVLGGDQLYSDGIWERCEALREWNELPDRRKDDKLPEETADRLSEQVGQFYFDLYCQQWGREWIRDVMASIPTLMMWDDHDIFDGWGSYTPEKQNSDVFQAIFKQARAHFCLFQLQADLDELEAAREEHAAAGFEGRFGGDGPRELPALLPKQSAFSYAYQLGNAVLVSPDMRSERTRDEVMSDRSREALYEWMDGLKREECENFVLLSPIPIVYANVSMLESVLRWAPWQDDPDKHLSISDDLGDQWMSRGHRVERLRLINRLLDFADKKQCRVTLVSGDVHVGGMGRIEARAGGAPARDAWTINQLISSPIVHPPAGLIVHLLERQIDGIVEGLENGSREITAQMVKLPTSGRYLINARNWLSLTFDYKKRIWAEWFIEDSKPSDEDEPYTKLSQVIYPVGIFN